MDTSFGVVRRVGLGCLLAGAVAVGAVQRIAAQEATPEPPKGGSTGSPKAPGKPQKGVSEGLKGTDAAQTSADKSAGSGAGKLKKVADKDAGGKPEKTAYDYELPGADGKAIKLSSLKGKVVLIVNLARNSSYNAQLAGLEKVSETYKDKGLVVIGVPSNEFGAAEPGTDAEIQKSYAEAKVTFPLTVRSSLTGVEELPLFTYMTKGKTVPPGGSVHWNYTKFILDRTGKVVARFESDVAPDSPEMLTTLDQILDGRFKPHKDAPKEGGADEDSDDDSGL